jgi:hypothetical protein
MMEGMIPHFVWTCTRVMTALILVVLVLDLLELTEQSPSEYCCGVFSAISEI